MKKRTSLFSGATPTAHEEFQSEREGGPLSTVMTDMMSWFHADPTGSGPSFKRQTSQMSSVAKDESGSEISDDFDDGPKRPQTRQQNEKEIIAAATSAKELAALQSQAQEIERNLRNLKSKLAGDTGSKKAERQEDVKILAEILADIRRQEAEKKQQITSAMGLSRKPGHATGRSRSRSRNRF